MLAVKTDPEELWMEGREAVHLFPEWDGTAENEMPDDGKSIENAMDGKRLEQRAENVGEGGETRRKEVKKQE